MATPAKKPIKISPQIKRKFAFDLRKPIFTGPLLKQGGFHKAFKNRYFVLYPGFLVYYDTSDRWKYDLQRGDTLGSRVGAIKLKGGAVHKTKNPPRGAKYAFTIECPDHSNKRNEVTFNCHSNEERYQWITNIASAIPSPGESLRKTEPKDEGVKKDETKKEDEVVPSPESTLRQDTVNEAALLASSKDEEEEEETHTDDILGPLNSPPIVDSDADELDDDSKGIVSSASVTVDSPVSSSSATDEETAAVEEETDPSLNEVKEIVLQPDEKAQFLISVVDPSLLADSDQDLSEEDLIPSPIHKVPTSSDTSDSRPDQPTSPISPPPPPPAITVTKGTLPKNSNNIVTDLPKEESKEHQSSGDESGNSSPELGKGYNRDKRRPSGAMSFVDKRGYLYKMGGKIKSWHLRYFVLQPGVFRYYKNSPTDKQLGEVKLKNVRVTLPKEGDKIFSSFQFLVHTESSWNSRMDWHIAAANEKDMKEWMEAFNLAGGGQIETNGTA